MTIEDTLRQVVREELERALGDPRPIDYDVPALAELFDVSERTARRLAREMEAFGAYKDRGEWWVPAEAIRNYQAMKRRQHHGVDEDAPELDSWRDVRRDVRRAGTARRRRSANGQ